MVIVKALQIIFESFLPSGFDNHLVLSAIAENTQHILAVERIIAKSAESYLTFSLRFRCDACSWRYQQQQQQRKKDEANDGNLEEEEDLSLPILFDDESSPPSLKDVEEEENDCTCRLMTPLQFKVP